MSSTPGSAAGGPAPSRPPWWMFILAALFIGYQVLLFYSDLTRPEPVGFVLGIRESEIVVRAVASASPAARAGLEVGDRVLIANSHPLRSRLDRLSVEMNLRTNQPLRLEVAPHSGRQTIVLVPSRAPWSYWTTTAGATLLSVRSVQLVTLVLALVVAFRRPFDTSARVGAWVLATLAVYSIVWPYQIAATWRALPTIVGLALWVPFASSVAVAATLFTFFATFPRPIIRPRWAWLVVWAPMMTVLLLQLQFAGRVVYRPDQTGGFVDWTPVSAAITTGYTIAAVTILAIGYRHLTDLTERRRVRVLVIGSSVGLLSALPVVAGYWGRSAGKVPVNLNFTSGSEAIASAVEQCQIRTVLTSRVFLAKAKVAQPDGCCFLEDVMQEISPVLRAGMLAAGLLLPPRVIEWLFLGGDRNPDSLATVIFSSGSTGTPKGVMLSHRNILANVEGIARVYRVTDDDRLMGVLPLFHSFGLTGSIWLPLVTGFGVVYHSNPLDAGTIGEMIQKYRATMIISTPSFCLGYARKCSAEQFATLRYAVVGAEKLREPIARAFKEKYGLDLMEGYGCTEMAPVVSVNAPDYPVEGRKGWKPGTVGRPLPGVAARIVDRETEQPVAPGTEGLLLVKGANLMLGYLNAPEKTREVLRDGWYVTGDIATIDEDGFIRLTDRLSRFSKIAGEMVPHVKIEETLTQILGDSACVAKICTTSTPFRCSEPARSI